MTFPAALKWVLPLLLLAGCGPESDKDARLLCSLQAEAFFMEFSNLHGYRIRRVPSADQLCPKR